MGTCAGKCSHCPPHDRHLLSLCSQKLIQGLRDQHDSAQLLVFDPAGSAGDGKNGPSRQVKSEEEVFGYSSITQENRGAGGSKQSSASRVLGKTVVNLAEGLTRTLMDMAPVSRNDKNVPGAEEKITTELSMYIVTWNMNSKALVRSIAKLLDVDAERHDLYVIGLQEAHNSVDESVVIEALGEKYSSVATASMVSLQLFVIAKKAILPYLSKPLVDKLSTGGLGGFAGRQKGAVAITLRFRGASLLFIACHLAPHEGNVEDRNAQYRRISQVVFAKQAQAVRPGVCSGCSSYGSSDGSAAEESRSRRCMDHPFRPPTKFIDQADVVVWMGDLNYRVEMSRSSVAFLIRHKMEEVLWSKDQLTRALKRGQAFIGFQEGRLSFRPTYKYDVGTDNYDSSSKERVPSWTDRILYKVNVRDRRRLSVHLKGYNAIDSIRSSDHRPVKAQFTLSLNHERK